MERPQMQASGQEDIGQGKISAFKEWGYEALVLLLLKFLFLAFGLTFESNGTPPTLALQKNQQEKALILKRNIEKYDQEEGFKKAVENLFKRGQIEAYDENPMENEKIIQHCDKVISELREYERITGVLRNVKDVFNSIKEQVKQTLAKLELLNVEEPGIAEGICKEVENFLEDPIADLTIPEKISLLGSKIVEFPGKNWAWLKAESSLRKGIMERKRELAEAESQFSNQKTEALKIWHRLETTELECEESVTVLCEEISIFVVLDQDEMVRSPMEQIKMYRSKSRRYNFILAYQRCINREKELISIELEAKRKQFNLVKEEGKELLRMLERLKAPDLVSEICAKVKCAMEEPRKGYRQSMQSEINSLSAKISAFNNKQSNFQMVKEICWLMSEIEKLHPKAKRSLYSSYGFAINLPAIMRLENFSMVPVRGESLKSFASRLKDMKLDMETWTR